MIQIIEKRCEKVSGITSLFVSFNYKPEVVTVIKNADKYIYNNKTFTWELPLTSLAYLVNNLTYIDDITLKIKGEDEEGIHFYPKLTHTYPPFQHQIEGIEYGLNNDSFLLLDDPGMGKTLQMIYLAEELREQKGLEHCLIICGLNTLKQNWKKQVEKYSSLSCRVIGEKINKKGNVSYLSVKERAEEIKNPLDAFFYIINIEAARNDLFIEAIKKSKNKIGMIVLDEAHRIKGFQSVQTHNLLKLDNYNHKIALTGTLIVNNPLDAYTSLKWIGVEKSNLTNFKGQYCEYGGFGGHEIIGYKNLDILKAEIESCSLRRRKEDLKDFPKKTVIPQIVEMEDSHRKFYEAIKDGIKEECDKIELKYSNVLALTTRLRQATSCPSLLTTKSVEASKLIRACELVDEIVASGNKVVIMSVFKEPLNELAKMLTKYNPLIGSGDFSDDTVTKNINLFQTEDKYKVFLGTVSKVGTGIDLDAASYAIFIDTPWTSALQEQAEDRINRLSSTLPAIIYRLICQGTIDEAIESMIEAKQAMSDFIVDDVANEKAIELLRNYILDL